MESWRAFIGRIRNYPAERTRPGDQYGTESSAEDQNGEYSAAVERRERIIKLRLGNEARRTSLEVLRQNSITFAECVKTIDGIKRVVSADLLGFPVNLCHKLANCEAEHIQRVLDAALRSSLARLCRPENYLCSNPVTGHDSPWPVSVARPRGRLDRVKPNPGTE